MFKGVNKSFNNDKTVELLSFVGIPGELGTMKLCKKYNNKSIDLVVIDFLHNQYKNYNALDNEDQNNMLQFTAEQLPSIYKNCGIIYDKGFSITWPRLEREFFFEPNDHENCRLCSELPENNITTNTLSIKDIRNNSNSVPNNCLYGRCLPERKKSNICCPEYGLSIISSSFSQDSAFTLSGVNDRVKSNLNISLSTKDYWKGRAAIPYKYLIDQIYNEKYIHLTDLTLLFKSMGFKNIYIYDPTCRECEIDKDKAEEYRSLENTIPNKEERIISQQPTNIVFSSDENPLPKTNYFDDCINGICGYFNKTKVDGGRRKKGKQGKTRKVFRKKKKGISKKYLKKKVRKQQNKKTKKYKMK